MQTAYDLVWLSGERTPDHLALVDDVTDRALSYRELLVEIDAVAAGLQARGVRAGQLIATALPGLFDHAVLLLALQRLGAVPRYSISATTPARQLAIWVAIASTRRPPPARMFQETILTGAQIPPQRSRDLRLRQVQ